MSPKIGCVPWGKRPTLASLVGKKADVFKIDGDDDVMNDDALEVKHRQWCRTSLWPPVQHYIIYMVEVLYHDELWAARAAIHGGDL